VKRLVLWVYLVVAASQVGLGDEWYERWSKAGNTWHERWSNLADQASTMRDEERIALFSPALMSNEGALYKGEDLELYIRIQQLLVATPGHADFHARRIKDAQSAYEQAMNPSNHGKPESNDLAGENQSKLLNVQTRSFQALGNMPSPETVRVLGEFLFDPWGLDPNAKPGQFENKEKLGQVDHAGYAMRALARLPLETRANATPSEKTQYWNDIDAWKLWFEQVKAGTRTFRFKGDPQNYSLAGPVSEAREPKTDRAPRTNEVSASTIETEKKATSFPIWPLTLAGVLLAVAIWFATKRKSSAA
jgi:hypothetical protein